MIFKSLVVAAALLSLAASAEAHLLIKSTTTRGQPDDSEHEHAFCAGPFVVQEGATIFVLATNLRAPFHAASIDLVPYTGTIDLCDPDLLPIGCSERVAPELPSGASIYERLESPPPGEYIALLRGCASFGDTYEVRLEVFEEVCP